MFEETYFAPPGRANPAIRENLRLSDRDRRREACSLPTSILRQWPFASINAATFRSNAALRSSAFLLGFGVMPIARPTSWKNCFFRTGEMTGGSARESRNKKLSTRFFSRDINKSSACSQTQSSSCSTGLEHSRSPSRSDEHSRSPCCIHRGSLLHREPARKCS